MNQLYQCWNEMITWFSDYARENNLSLIKESDFTDFIYRMERDYQMPTTVQSISLGYQGDRILLASASPPQEPLKSIHLRLMSGHQSWHLHVHENHLVNENRPFGKEKLYKILDRIFFTKKPIKSSL